MQNSMQTVHLLKKVDILIFSQRKALIASDSPFTNHFYN